MGRRCRVRDAQPDSRRSRAQRHDAQRRCDDHVGQPRRNRRLNRADIDRRQRADARHGRPDLAGAQRLLHRRRPQHERADEEPRRLRHRRRYARHARRLHRLAGADRVPPGRSHLRAASAAAPAAAATAACAGESTADRDRAVRSVHGRTGRAVNGHRECAGSRRRSVDVSLDGAERHAAEPVRSSDAVDGGAAGRQRPGHGHRRGRQGRHGARPPRTSR